MRCGEECGCNLFQILVAHCAEDDGDGRFYKFIQIITQSARARDVVRAVKEKRRMSLAQIQPSRVYALFKSLYDGCVWNRKPTLAQSFCQRDCRRSIRRLMPTTQAQTDVLVSRRLRLESRAHPPRLVRADYFRFALINSRRDYAISASLENHFESFRILRGDDGCHSGTNYSGLLGGYLRQRRA